MNTETLALIGLVNKLCDIIEDCETVLEKGSDRKIGMSTEELISRARTSTVNARSFTACFDGSDFSEAGGCLTPNDVLLKAHKSIQQRFGINLETVDFNMVFAPSLKDPEMHVTSINITSKGSLIS